MYGVYEYTVGDLVQLGHRSPVQTITWRGWLLVPNGIGFTREAVYVLDYDGERCYYEAELFPLGQAPIPRYNYSG